MTSGDHSALISGVHKTASPPRGDVAGLAVRVLRQPLMRILFDPFCTNGGASTASASPLSLNMRSACSAGTPQTSLHANSAALLLTYNRRPHCPNAPRLLTNAPMVTYSKYDDDSLTGDVSYSRATVPPSVQPSTDSTRTFSGKLDLSGELT
eukprot:CAMPEP_0119326630 /NCGR_PEP_ID=MMETSP1333-20130426/68902_1 /TAXON_ID=418940 /ORGANISM="Scyphosphaera apsteinii, Strain RCC1455" /LENGTH=151 /DNA_ID=CAMNT_0007334989 /DNA_START=130 /DNA_END=581 /DNA_ORIENTATION=-